MTRLKFKLCETQLNCLDMKIKRNENTIRNIVFDFRYVFRYHEPKIVGGLVSGIQKL